MNILRSARSYVIIIAFALLSALNYQIFILENAFAASKVFAVALTI